MAFTYFLEVPATVPHHYLLGKLVLKNLKEHAPAMLIGTSVPWRWLQQGMVYIPLTLQAGGLPIPGILTL